MTFMKSMMATAAVAVALAAQSATAAPIKSLILGGFDDLGDSAVPFGATVAEMALDHASGHRFPILAGFPCGHGGANVPVPWGTRCRFVADRKGVRDVRVAK